MVKRGKNIFLVYFQYNNVAQKHKDKFLSLEITLHPTVMFWDTPQQRNLPMTLCGDVMAHEQNMFANIPEICNSTTPQTGN